MNRLDFSKWAMGMVSKVDFERFFTYTLPDNQCKNVVVCYDKRTGKIGVARCHPKDRFNLLWGKAIATARCLGVEVPKMTECFLHEMTYGKRFRYNHKVYVFLCKIPDCNCYAVKEVFGKGYLFNFADTAVEMVE